MTTDLWDWAVSVYGRNEVAEACLVLQDDHDQCVPLLLWAAWRAHEGRGIDAPEAVKAAGIARIWADEVIAPLRQVRRRLKTPLEEGDEALRLPLREKIKGMELEAERALMRRLSDVSQEKPYLKQRTDEALVAVARAWAANVPKERLNRLAEALTKA
ncbi:MULTISPECIES: TIGR02444 family protein [Asticcacaulis]|uniref:TIGR02444 family protein n=1 Tax=Asticcacaulis TaxID=76890 RepID=UPI001AE532AE|nr:MULTISPECIES: TIGR02444 family protein [Asticcacaulis]MBP2160862.1 uncharacterized protein (TIGR02444 family) [Asticcacaulis solisilvae]MDR6801934.1 uncharacterized protein (TIGR02444 family) [Asticcacaulis sp. BE141]